MLRGQAATSGVFTALGIEPLLGRSLRREDDQMGASRVTVLSYGLWQELFGGDSAALGRDVILDGIPHTIVGIMPSEFVPATGIARLWAPLTDKEKADHRDSQFLSVVGRLAEGVSLDNASQRLAALQERLARIYPDSQGDVGSRAVGLLDSVVGNVRPTLWFLLAAVALVLFVASANVANLLSVMGLTRRRDLAIRAALGARAGHLIRGRLIESGVLAGLGGLAGAGLAWASLPLMLRLLPQALPRHELIGIDGTVLLFGLVLTMFTALLMGTLPAFQASGADPLEMMRINTRGPADDRLGNRIRAGLVSTEVAVAYVLLIVAALLGTSFARLWSVDRGFATEGIVVMAVLPDPISYPGRSDRDQFVTELRERLRGIPGVLTSATNQVPLSGSTTSTTYEVERSEGEPEETSTIISVVLENYFGVMSIPLLYGRTLSSADRRDAPPVAVINQAMARRLWPGESPLGRRLRSDGESPWKTVVGVVGDVRHQGLTVETHPKLYLPAAQSGRLPFEWVLRGAGDLTGIIKAARRAVAEISPTTPVRGVTILQNQIAQSVAVPRFRTLCLVALAAMASVLSLLGIFAVISLSVTHRTREMAVRIALGSRPDRVVRQFLGTGLKLTLRGLLLGLAGAIPAATVVRAFLFQVEPINPFLYFSVALGVIVVSCAASYIPARRAAALDPVKLLNLN